MIHENTFYIGFSRSSQNINFHGDEARIRSRVSKKEISRAESKLIEAISTFNVEICDSGKALDLGAAPGGWSKVLADYGYEVLAVDPASLDPVLEDYENIKHIKAKAEDLELDEPLDLIVNDMNIGSRDTARIMCEVKHLLKDGSLAILTLKLPGNVKKRMEEATSILKEKYEILEVRSLFHNKREVTVLLKNLGC